MKLLKLITQPTGYEISSTKMNSNDIINYCLIQACGSFLMEFRILGEKEENKK